MTVSRFHRHVVDKQSDKKESKLSDSIPAVKGSVFFLYTHWPAGDVLFTAEIASCREEADTPSAIATVERSWQPLRESSSVFAVLFMAAGTPCYRKVFSSNDALGECEDSNTSRVCVCVLDLMARIRVQSVTICIVQTRKHDRFSSSLCLVSPRL